MNGASRPHKSSTSLSSLLLRCVGLICKSIVSKHLELSFWVPDLALLLYSRSAPRQNFSPFASSLKLNESIIFHFPPWLTPECLSYTLSLTRAQLRENFCQGGACVHARSSLSDLPFTYPRCRAASCAAGVCLGPILQPHTEITRLRLDFCSLGQFITLSGFTPR